MRMMSPDGTLGLVPEENVEAAQADGWKIMTDDDMVALFNRSELERRFFEKNWGASHKPLKRASGSSR